jgi:hypothetical protein
MEEAVLKAYLTRRTLLATIAVAIVAPRPSRASAEVSVAQYGRGGYGRGY